jgi:hypothetical protein
MIDLAVSTAVISLAPLEGADLGEETPTDWLLPITY